MSENANIIINLTALVLVFMLLYVAWPKAVVDTIRQRIFEIRDELFDMAAEGQIRFDDPVYVRFRDTANTLIRFCHNFSWPRVFCLALAIKASGNGREYVPIHESISDKDPLHDKMMGMEAEMLLLVWRAMYLRSPLFLLLTPLAVVFTLFFVLNPVQPRKLRRRAARLSGEIADVDAALTAAG